MTWLRVTSRFPWVPENFSGFGRFSLFGDSSSGHILTNEAGQPSEKMFIWVSSWGESQGKRRRWWLMPQAPLAQR